MVAPLAVTRAYNLMYSRGVMRAQNVTLPRFMGPAFTKTSPGVITASNEMSPRVAMRSHKMRRCAALSGRRGMVVQDDYGTSRCAEANDGT